MSAQSPANPGVPGLVHFWDPSTAAYAKIAAIYNKGSEYTNEDVVWHAWGEICSLYFPTVATTPAGPRWAIDREAYRGLPPLRPSQIKPDLIAIKLSPGQTIAGQVPQFSSRDFLWIECKAASEDTPYGWKPVLNEMEVHVFWVVSYEPAHTGLVISRFDGNGYWDIDTRIRAMHAAPWVNTTTREIICGRATELECWTTVPGQTILQNRDSLGMIEQFLVSIQNIALQGLNPAEF